ncbi:MULTISPECIES: carotenoid oxygenase family protein [Cyanophyceae]|uniref:carotenoid oxygenase family protein n=1 Tax=Cyanophyceae TaxID=3028117 RepID=UPI001685A2DE|nr:carotenoid oxygenase family protein [Trichocoleus sp. FACHB-69]MBD1933834.1 carotenoid oxygenase family protein [Trichocoleus sp. FACHB-69]
MQNLPTQERFPVPTEALDELPYHIKQWQKGYESLPQEFDYWIDDIEGQIPAELEGTLFRNGPGLLDVNGQRIHHPFDGDGMICRVAFSNGRAHFCNRFVRTQGYVEEQASGKILYRGVFGTQKPGGWLANAFDLKLKNIANTNVIYWGDKLLALWEAAEPHQLDPQTLETLGKDYLDGVLHNGDAFAAHPRIDGETLVNFAIKPGLSTTITIYELDSTGKVIQRHAHSVPGFAFIHDFAITPNYCLFFQNPVSFNPLPFVFGVRGAGECVQFQPDQPTKILVIPRNPQQRKVQILETQSGFVFHHANAFEQDDKICIDSICYESFPSVEADSDYREVKFEELAPGQMWRFTLNLNDKTVQRKLLEGRCCEFPSVHPERVGRPYRYLYMGAAHNATGNAPLQAILKADLETGQRQLWSVAPQGFVSEPVFVPRPGTSGEDEGWLLAFVYDSTHHRSDVVILDAGDLNKGPVARLHLKHHVPYGLHGNFTSQCFAPRK